MFNPEMQIGYRYPMVISTVSKTPEGEIKVELEIFVTGDISEIHLISFTEGSREWHDFFRSVLPDRLEEWAYRETIGASFLGKIVIVDGVQSVEVVQSYFDTRA